MIQDIGNHVYNNAYTPHDPRPGDILFVFSQGQILCSTDGSSIRFPQAIQAEGQKLQFLFHIDDTAYYLGQEAVDGYTFQSMRLLRHSMPQHQCFAGMTAWHLYQWYSSHRYCGKCASGLLHHDTTRSLICPTCGNQIFPVIAPAVIVAVINEDRILITRYAGREHKGIAL
ncbi:MAG: NAD(+) diphosphatase, partial [Oscillospiraceae bacterium]|nr:NAD(+) diphosphatase [Oscillospiraceae bacterium]